MGPDSPPGRQLKFPHPFPPAAPAPLARPRGSPTLHRRVRPSPRRPPPHPAPHDPPPPGVPGPHLSRRRPRLPATSASLLHPRPSGARSKLPLSLRSSGSGRRLRVAPAAAGSGGPEGAAGGGDEVRGGGACSSSPHSDRSRAGDPKPAAAPVGRIARLPLAAALRRQGRKDEAEGAARSSEEEAPLPAPPRPVCLREPDWPAAPAAPGAGPRRGRGRPLRACARLPRPPRRPLSAVAAGARPSNAGEVELGLGGKGRAVAGGGGSDGGTTPGRLYYDEEACGAGASQGYARRNASGQGASARLSVARPAAPPEARSADSLTPAPASGHLSEGVLVFGLDVYGSAEGGRARDPDRYLMEIV